jgi:hypothetical protein
VKKLPDEDKVADAFKSFFIRKIEDIRQNIYKDYIKRLIRKAENKSG